MNAITGRLSELGAGELLKLLASVRAVGTLELQTQVGSEKREVRSGQVSGGLSPVLRVAYDSRSGAYRFTPGEVAEAGDWMPVEELIARLEAASRPVVLSECGTDALADLRDELAAGDEAPEAPIPIAALVADPRPYRSMEAEWRQRGWVLTFRAEPPLPAGADARLVIVHLPSSGTMAGRAASWLRVVSDAVARGIPVLWVGGLADRALRHDAIVAGVDFMLPAPAGEVGQAARWFREEVTTVAERLLASRRSDDPAAEAVRDIFFTLQADAAPAEVRASLLRFASSFFSRGVLLAVHDGGFQPVGTFGLQDPGHRLSRGEGVLEEVVVDRRPRRVDGTDAVSLGAELGLDGPLLGAEVLPVPLLGECVALFVGDRPAGAGSTALAALLARCGAMLGLRETE